MGRPPIPKSLKRMQKVQLNVTQEEYEQLDKASKEGKFRSLSDYLRKLLGFD